MGLWSTAEQGDIYVETEWSWGGEFKEMGQCGKGGEGHFRVMAEYLEGTGARVQGA